MILFPTPDGFVLLIMKNELRCRPMEAGLPDQHHPVQTGLLDTPHKTFGDAFKFGERAGNRTDSMPAA